MRRFMRPTLGLSIAALIMTGCSSSIGRSDRQANAPLFKGMGSHTRTVTTSSSDAQRYFNQGLVWTYAFNHDEAIRSFETAARIDPDCAMAWWGIALCNGPHINNPIVPPDRADAAWDALQSALAARNHASPVERQLIDALAHRYANPQPEDRAPLDQAYADAMQAVWEKNPDDSDVGTLYAEALMDLRPWDLWQKNGDPQPGTEKVLAVLERVIELDPDNPGAHHLYIHAVEAGPNPSRASASADRLRDLVPASGHLVHMPSHIDVLTGRWEEASDQNVLAVTADEKYQARSPKQGFYRLYMLHNHHMLSFASMMIGRQKIALSSARGAVDGIPDDVLCEQAALADPYMGAALDVLKRFGRWEDILREPPPADCLPITTAMWRYARGLSYAALGKVELARQEQAAFDRAVTAVPDDALMAINQAHDILDIAGLMLDAEIDYRAGDVDGAIATLKTAVDMEDELMYMEPPEWIQPVRHTLGAFLLSEGRYAEAESVYRADLAKWPGNGWSLYGLSRSLEGQGNPDQARKYRAEFQATWAKADTPIASSCLCVPKT